MDKYLDVTRKSTSKEHGGSSSDWYVRYGRVAVCTLSEVTGSFNLPIASTGSSRSSQYVQYNRSRKNNDETWVTLTDLFHKVQIFDVALCVGVDGKC